MLDLGRTLIAVAEREPDAVAIVDGERRETYAGWLDQILRVAAGLTDLGLERGDHLVVALQNRWEMATLHWACQLSAIVMTPVNWRATGDELDFVLGDADAKAVVFQDVSAGAVSTAPLAGGIPRCAVGGAPGGTLGFGHLLEREPAPLSSAADVLDTSLMLYTSGTTGRGKGVPRSHHAERAAALTHIAQNQYGYGERTLGVMPLYHTMGVRALLTSTLLSGRFVCQRRFEPGAALALIEREGVTSLFLVPTLFHDLLSAPGFESANLHTVRKLGFAGASMTDGLLERLVAAFRPDLFVNHYGSSEIYTFTICQQAHSKPGSAGKAGLNQQIRVVAIGAGDPERVAAVGEEGEIIATLASDEAFAGYWRRPDADAKALHGGWYFTGDIGYRDEEGDLFVTGRVDDMMISGGENIMPVEIESLLSLHPAVAEVAVAGLPDERLGQRVTAFVRRRAPVDGETLDAYCRSSGLAGFKRPRGYLFVREIPKSPVGKILRRLLVAGEYETE